MDQIDLIKQYNVDIEKDLEITDFNIKERALTVASKKHYWVARLIKHKQNLNNLQQERKTVKSTITRKLLNESPVAITLSAASNKSEEHEKIKDIDSRIRDEQLIVEYLEKIEKIFSSLTWDIKNIIAIIQAEQL